MTTFSRILGFGHYLPAKVMTNADFEKMVETSDEWIRTRTGIRERHFTEDGETASTMAAEAARRVIEKSGIDKNDIDAILVATVTADMHYPSTAALVQRTLGLTRHIPAFDIGAACAGFVFGITTADSFIKSGLYRTILVIGTENLSKFTDMQDRNTCVLFGDGAGATILQASDAPGILAAHLATDGNFSHLIEFPAGGSRIPATHETVEKRLHYTRMEGQEVYKQAVKDMSEAALESMKIAGLSLDQVSWIIPHQANTRIIETVGKRLNFPMEKVYQNIDHVGNTSAASIPIALSEMEEKGLLKHGQNIVLTALGSGLTYGSVAFCY
ncbi:MAG TPA: beta-ketoacyl-ACP synthase III [bacterium]|nr:beta-ketoacyl-ACP synthase III [bacterium]